MPSIPAAFTSEDDVEQGEDPESLDPDNSHPVNFDTFIPRHDPSLCDAKHGTDENLGNDATGAWRGIVPPAASDMSTQVTSNEAFERAMGAWYWAGYWTGVYHVSRLYPSPAETPRTNFRVLQSSVKKVIQRSEINDQLERVDEAMAGNIEQEEQEAPSEQVEDNDLIPT